MKKLSAIILAMLMLLTITACGNGNNDKAYEAYVAAADAVNAADSLSVKTSTKMQMSSGGETIHLNMVGTMQIVKTSETSIDMAMDMTVEMEESPEMSADLKLYYTNDTMYLDMQGVQMKKAATQEEVEDISSELATEAMKFPKEAIKNQKMSETGDETTIDLTLKSDAVNELVENATASIMDSLQKQLNLSKDQMQATYADVLLHAVLSKDGSMRNVVMTVPMTVKADGESLDANVEISLDYLQVGDVTINFPEDLDSYIDMGEANVPLS